MTTTIENYAHQVAERVISAWAAKRHPLDRFALPYLDRLMDELVRKRPIGPGELSSFVHHIVPGMQLGTAKRLVGLKFGWPEGNLVASPQPQ